MNIQLTLLLSCLSVLLTGCGTINDLLNSGVSLQVKYGNIKEPQTVQLAPCYVCKNNREIIDNIIDKIIDKQPIDLENVKTFEERMVDIANEIYDTNKKNQDTLENNASDCNINELD